MYDQVLQNVAVIQMAKGKIKSLGRVGESQNMLFFGFIYLFQIGKCIWWRANAIPKSSLVFQLVMSWGRKGVWIRQYHKVALSSFTVMTPVLSILEFTTQSQEACCQLCYMFYFSLFLSVETFPRNLVARSFMI